ncbi:7801_t:CDS:2 [Entrophospora sp. SA101]|nr:7801_t:CDS:2 [Entrophospora sp. SA101]
MKNEYLNQESKYRQPKTLDREQLEYTITKTLSYSVLIFAALGASTGKLVMTCLGIAIGCYLYDIRDFYENEEEPEINSNSPPEINKLASEPESNRVTKFRERQAKAQQFQAQKETNLNPTNLIKSAQELKQSLTAIAPDDSKTTKIITFALAATAIMGMFVYHYIKKQEANS